MLPNEGEFLKKSWIIHNLMHFLRVQNWSGLTDLQKLFAGRLLKNFPGCAGAGLWKILWNATTLGFQKTFWARAGIRSSPFNTSVLNPENLKISHKIKCHSGNNFQTIYSKLLPPNRKIISCKSRKTLRNFCKLKSTVKKIVVMIYW